MGRQTFEYRRYIQDFIHHKLHIAQGRGVAWHGQIFLRLGMRRSATKYVQSRVERGLGFCLI